jgi:hypothetical protein
VWINPAHAKIRAVYRFYLHILRSLSFMPELATPGLAGTMPEVRLRPKVAKKPTIAALPAPRKNAELEAATPIALVPPWVDERKPRIVKQAPPKPDTALVGSTMPEKKPLVKVKKPQPQIQGSVAPDNLLAASVMSLDEVTAPESPVLIDRLFAEKASAAVEPKPVAVTAVNTHWIDERKPRIVKQAPPKPDTALVGGTMPEKKPLVKVKKPLVRPNATAAQSATQSGPKTIAATIPEKKPLVTKQAKVAAEANEISWTAGWMTWLPIALGIALASVAPSLHALAALHNPWGLRVVFPFVQLAALREIGMSDELTRTMPQLMLYLQFPLEGMLVAFNLRRGMKFHSAVAPIPALHFVAGLTLWIVRLGAARPI